MAEKRNSQEGLMQDRYDISNAGIEEIVLAGEELNTLALAQKRVSEGIPEEEAEGDKFLREYSHTHAQKIVKDYEGTPETINQELIDSVIGTRAQVLKDIRRDAMTKRLDYVLGDEQIGKSALELLASDKNLRSSAEEDELKVLRVYDAVNATKNVLKALEEKEFSELPDNLKKQLIENAAVGAGQKAMDDFKERGYSEKAQERAGMIAQRAVLHGHYSKDKITEYAKIGLNEQLKRVNEEYDKVAKEAKTDVYGVVRNVVKRLASRVETREQAEGLVVGAYKSVKENSKDSEDPE